MPRRDVARCKSCGGHRDEVGPLSWTRQCITCAEATLSENIVGLATKSGEPIERWRRGMILSAGGILPDQLTQRS